MVMMLAVLLQMAPTVPQDIALREARQLLEERVSNLEAGLLFLEGFVQKLSDYVATPTTGMVVVSPAEPDSTGLHRLIVHSIFTDGPANRASILPGDRIVAVGPRRLEHETATVFRNLVDRDTGPVELTVRRAGVERVTIVHREVSDCMKRALQYTNVPMWEERIARLKKSCVQLRSLLAFSESEAPSELMRLHGLYKELHTEFMGTMDQMKDHMNKLRHLSCKEQFE